MCATSSMEVTSTTSRKIRKPLMEKKRRARINHSLNELKRLLTEASRKEGSKAKAAKLEKADILELAVKHVQYLHDKYKITESKENVWSAGKDEEARRRILPGSKERSLTLGPRGIQVRGVTKLASGEIALLIAAPVPHRSRPADQDSSQQPPRLMWRPW